MAKNRRNVIPIIEDARHPARYRMLVGMVDVIFSDVAQPDQVTFLIFCIRSYTCHTMYSVENMFQLCQYVTCLSETTSLSSQSRDKVVYILPSPYPIHGNPLDLLLLYVSTLLHVVSLQKSFNYLRDFYAREVLIFSFSFYFL